MVIKYSRKSFFEVIWTSAVLHGKIKVPFHTCLCNKFLTIWMKIWKNWGTTIVLPCHYLFTSYVCSIVNKFYLLFFKCSELQPHTLVRQLCKPSFALPFLCATTNFFHSFCHALCPCKKKSWSDVLLHTNKNHSFHWQKGGTYTAVVLDALSS